jgi:acyl-CoA hydrolase
MKKTTVDLSPVSIFEEIFPIDTNPYGTAFGGKILALMDRAAGLAASKFARCHFVTVSLDALEFTRPVKQGEVAEVEARVVYSSSHTAGIKVTVYAIDKCRWDRRQCCHGTIFMVSTGEGGKRAILPDVRPTSATRKREWAEVRDIHLAMLERKNRKA